MTPAKIEIINVMLTPKVMADTTWFIVADDTSTPEALDRKQWTQVLYSPQIPDVLYTKSEKGDAFWYDDVLYPVGNPLAVREFYNKWNRDHGYAD